MVTDLGSWLLPSCPLVLPDPAMDRPSPSGRPLGSSLPEVLGLIMWDVRSALCALPELRRMPFGGRPLTPSPSDLHTSRRRQVKTTDTPVQASSACQELSVS